MQMPQLEVHTFIPQLFWLAISFALLYWFLSKIATPYLKGIILLRENKIERDLEKAKKYQEAATKLKEQCETAYANVTKLRNDKIADILEEISKNTELKLQEHDEHLNELLKASEKSLQDFAKQNNANIKKIASDAVKVILKDLAEIQDSPKEGV